MLLWLVRFLVKIHPMHFMVASITEMGWGISVEDEEDDTVQGLVIGTEGFIDRHIPEEVE